MSRKKLNNNKNYMKYKKFLFEMGLIIEDAQLQISDNIIYTISNNNTALLNDTNENNYKIFNILKNDELYKILSNKKMWDKLKSYISKNKVMIKNSKGQPNKVVLSLEDESLCQKHFDSDNKNSRTIYTLDKDIDINQNDFILFTFYKSDKDRILDIEIIHKKENKKDKEDKENKKDKKNNNSDKSNGYGVIDGDIKQAFSGRGKDTWKNTTEDEIILGSGNSTGILTRPGTNMDMWNGKPLNQWNDPEGGTGVYKAYSKNGSEYIITDKGWTRRVKFLDPNTKGRDVGLQDWHKGYMIPINHPIYKSITEGVLPGKWISDNYGKIRLEPSKNDKNTLQFTIYDEKQNKFRPFDVYDIVKRESTRKLLTKEQREMKYAIPNDTDYTVNDNKALLEFKLNDQGCIISVHPSGGFACIIGKK